MDDLRLRAEQALAAMRRQGFDDAMVEASRSTLAELNVAHDEPTLMRGTVTDRLALLGLVDGRRASTELADLRAEAVQRGIAELFDAARAAPQDPANAVSADQKAEIAKGPFAPDRDAMADAMGELLAWRAAHTPTVTIEEAQLAHQCDESVCLTTRATALSCRLGWYEMGAMATAREGERSSSFNHGGGSFDRLDGEPPARRLGIEGIFADLARQVHTRSLDASFVGDVVLTPAAAESLFGWLRAQLSDLQLIAGTSLYRQRVGEVVASPLLSLASRFDAPGIAPLSADGFVTPPVELLRAGRLMTLTPSLYASRRTGIAHVPVAAGGWALAPGDTPLATLVGGVERGAIVGRLSMGSPAANGDFSGVIKNSFLIERGEVGGALSEVMISGNMAQMLRDVVALSRECLDTGRSCLPWVRVTGLHFS